MRYHRSAIYQIIDCPYLGAESMPVSQHALWIWIYTHSLSILFTVIGVVSVYMALFMYKDDFGHIQNLLAKMWVKVDDLAREASSKTAAFIKVLAEAVSSAFDRLFGAKVNSLRAVAVSGALSLAPVCLAQIYRQWEQDQAFQFMLLEFFIVLPVIMLWFTKTDYRAEAIVVFLLIVDVFLLLFLAVQKQGFLILAGGFCFAVSSDFALIALNRYGLKWCSSKHNAIKMLALLSLNFFLAIISCALPWAAAGYFEEQIQTARKDTSAQTLADFLAKSEVKSEITSLQPVAEDLNRLRSRVSNDLKHESLTSNAFLYELGFIQYRLAPFVQLCEMTEDGDRANINDEEERAAKANSPFGNLTAEMKQVYLRRVEQRVRERKTLRAQSCSGDNKCALSCQISFIGGVVESLRKMIGATAETQRKLRVYPAAAEDFKLLVLTNVDTLAMSILLIASMAGMLVHRLFWPVLARPLCALADLGFLRSKVLLGSIGISLLGVGAFRGKFLTLIVKIVTLFK